MIEVSTSFLENFHSSVVSKSLGFIGVLGHAIIGCCNEFEIQILTNHIKSNHSPFDKIGSV